MLITFTRALVRHHPACYLRVIPMLCRRVMNHAGHKRLFRVRLLTEYSMGAVQRMPSLKTFFMNEARGLSGQLPGLLR